MDIPMIPMEPKKFGLLVAILFFLISLLINLLQRRYGKARLGRMLEKEESVLDVLSGIQKYLGKLEMTCTLEVHGESSPQEVGKAISTARKKIQSTVADMEEHLHSFPQYRRKVKAAVKEQRQLKKTGQRR